ncbi:ROK family protein [Nonomuraea sp. NPDC047897]|uniref:ROK family protein n=1 Tax=Nonomuraea sp. NPDC047897 TaxID=3364346 RepID=UPI00371D2B65
MATNGATTSGELRAHNRVRLLRAVHDCGATLTRSRLTRDLELARGTASVLVAELADSALLHEEPAAEHGRGRPTQVPGPHPHGPIALAVDVREDAWEVTECSLGGQATVLEVRRHDGTPEGAFGPLGEVLRGQVDRLGPRVVGVGLAVAGPVRAGGLVDVAHLDWRSVDVPALLDLPPLGPPPEGGRTAYGAPPAGDGTTHDTPPAGHGAAHGMPLVGNDTAFAALAEARRGVLRGVRVGLHLHVDFDLGGVLVVDGRPLAGAGGIGAEFGHMPLTGGAEPCACGARGCWGREVGTNALLRRLGLAHGGGRGRDRAERVFADAAAGDAEAARALAANARALGTGVAALVNAHDPEVVSLSGFGVDLHARALAALTEPFGDGLMAIRRERPPRLASSTLGWRGALIGAMESVFDAFLTVEGVQAWRRARTAAPA